MFLFINF